MKTEAGACVLSHFSHVWLFATLWTVARQAPLVHGILQARILECVAISYSKGSSWPKDWTHAFCIFWISRWIIYHWATWEAWLYTQCSIIEVIIYTSTFPCFQIFRLFPLFLFFFCFEISKEYNIYWDFLLHGLTRSTLYSPQTLPLAVREHYIIYCISVLHFMFITAMHRRV